jgi:uncharacterized protein YodC (DUF2158 family)
MNFDPCSIKAPLFKAGTKVQHMTGGPAMCLNDSSNPSTCVWWDDTAKQFQSVVLNHESLIVVNEPSPAA